MKKSKKAKSPQDSTLRNIRAANKRFEELELRYRFLDERLVKLENFVFDPTGAYVCRDDLERAMKEGREKKKEEKRRRKRDDRTTTFNSKRAGDGKCRLH